MKNIIFWDVTPCSPVDVYGCFGVKQSIHLQDSGEAKQAQWFQLTKSWAYSLFSHTAYFQLSTHIGIKPTQRFMIFL
jgi:hypothetical protein